MRKGSGRNSSPDSSRNKPRQKPGERSGRPAKPRHEGDARTESRRPGFSKEKRVGTHPEKRTRNLGGKGKAVGKNKHKEAPETEFRLNRFIALSGICSRRDADELIRTGKIKVNGVVETKLGTKVSPDRDRVEYDGRELKSRNFVYILLNKPKNTITTTEDERGRDTVMDLIGDLTRERVYPVGRLDRNTTGLLLLTNDGDLAERLTHPSHGVKKIYHVKLNKAFSSEHMIMLNKGIDLEDGTIRADMANYVVGAGPDEIGIVLHSGRNRVVRRMMEHLGYEVLSLDRTGYANLTKKNLPRGTARKLTPKEISFLKML